MGKNNKRQEAPLDRVRIIGVFAHVDAGKTTTSEAILYYTGRIHRAGEIDEGTTQLDWMDQERERGITIMAAATACHWHGHRINLIDTPGHIDFTAEVVRSIRVIDGAVVVMCGVGGVEPQTETVWRHADREKLPRIIFVNKLDRTGANFERVLHEIDEQLVPHAVMIQVPVGREENFRGVVDLIDQKALIWIDDHGQPLDEPQTRPVPEELRGEVNAARERMLDEICETDDELLMKRLEGLECDPGALRAALRRATLAGHLVPVVCGAARNHIGVQPLLDAVVDYLPAPGDMPPILGMVPGRPDEVAERPDDPSAPFCASAFKIVTDPHVGHLTWVRVFSGHLQTGEMLYNPRAETTERVGRIYRMHANHREQVDHMGASDVVALVGVKSAITGDTLCDPEHPIMLESFKFPDPVIAIALKPSSTEERDKLRDAVQRLCAEDPTLISRYDPETEEQTLSGMGELHLEIAVERLRREFGLRPAVSQPQISYREGIRRTAEAVGTYRKQTGGHGHYAEVAVRIEPLERGDGIVFLDESSPAELPREFVRPTELGVREALERGVIAGYPFTDVRVTLLGGRYHEVDSAAMDFQIAGSMAVRQAVRMANPVLLEPVMSVDIVASEEHFGAVVADVGRRRGSVCGVSVRGTGRNVEGEVPLAEARGYATDLRSMTQGRGTFALEFDRYDLVPDAIGEEIIKQRRLEGKISER
jgi:elongation factor G